VHRSNFRVEGFTAEVTPVELAGLAAEAGIHLVHDLGSGALLDLTRLGLPPEPTAGDALSAGASVVTMSGDKLLGGPQAGILLGQRPLIDRMRSNPMCRAVRPDKLTLAALEATLALYRDPERAIREIPTLAMLGASADELAGRAATLADRLRAGGARVSTVETTSRVGGGAYPGVDLPSVAVALDPPPAPEEMARRLRAGQPPVVARVRDGRVLLDPRTVGISEEDALVDAVVTALATDRE
jgi:L-seryl-tRNA(Ser) seleniumtransferase